MQIKKATAVVDEAQNWTLLSGCRVRIAVVEKCWAKLCELTKVEQQEKIL